MRGLKALGASLGSLSVRWGKPAVAALSNLPTSHLAHSSSIKNPTRTATQNALETLASRHPPPSTKAAAPRLTRHIGAPTAYAMQRAAARAASLAIRRFASSASRPAPLAAAASLRPASAALNAGTRLSLQPTPAAAAAAALCCRRGYAGGARKTKAAVSEDEDDDGDDEFEAMGSDGEYAGDSDGEDMELDGDSEDDEEPPVKKRGRC